MKRKYYLIIILFIISLLFFNIFFTYFHISSIILYSSTTTSFFPSSSSSSSSFNSNSYSYLRNKQRNSYNYNYNKKEQKKKKNYKSKNWLDNLYNSLEDEILLTRNVKSKEHLWKNIELSNNFNKEEGEILVYLGWVAYWDMERYALNGGPSGEFVIFADLLTGLAAIGYHLTVVHTICDFWEVIKSNEIEFDFIITDYDGLGSAENTGDFPKRHCRYFIVDGFGTQKEFNSNRNLNLKHVLTPYPFDGSNTPIHMITDHLPIDKWIKPRLNQAVIWSKEVSYFYEKLYILREVSTVIPLVGTFGIVGENEELKFIHQKSHLNRTEFLQLLSSSRILLGVGNPLDGPTALEAISHGCIYINPIFNPPIQASSKPTRFNYTSQHPFIEKYITSPYVYNIDIKDTEALKRIIKQILQSNEEIEPFIHPFHKPEAYIENLRTIFNFDRRNKCELDKSIQPKRHPSNQVYQSFREFVQMDCGYSGCADHWTELNITSCISNLIEQNIKDGIPYNLEGFRLVMSSPTV